MMRKTLVSMLILSVFFLLPVNMAFAGGGCILTMVAIPSVGQVEVSWIDIGIDHYNVYRSTVMGGPYAFIGSTASSPYLDNAVTAGMRYYYVVRGALANGDELCQSYEASATLPLGVPEFGASIAIIASISMIGIILLRRPFLGRQR